MGTVLMPTGGGSKSNLLAMLSNKNFSLSQEDLEGCVQIGDYVFYNNTCLTKIDIPYGIMRIGEHAFDGCTSLTEIHIPGSVCELGDYALANCTSLTTIYYGGLQSGWNALPKGANWNANSSQYTIVYAEATPQYIVDIGYISELNGYSVALAYSSDEDIVVIPDTFNGYPVVQIGQYNVSTKKYKGVVIPPTVTNIVTNAFYSLDSIVSLTIPNSVTIIGSNATKPTGTQYVSIAGPNSAIGAFYGASTVNFFSTLQDATVKVGVPNNYQLSLESNTTTYDANSVLNGISGLTKIVIPEGVTTVTGYDALTNASYIELPDSLTTVQYNIFNNVNNPNNPKTIKCSLKTLALLYNGYAFNNGYQKYFNFIITHDDDNVSISSYSSSDCPVVSSLEFDNSIKDISIIPINSSTIIKFNGTQKEWFERDNYPKTSPYSSNYEFTNLYLYGEEIEGDFVVNNNVTKICYGSLGNIALTSISIPENIEYVLSLGDTTNLTFNEYNNGYYVGNTTNPYLVFVTPIASVSSLTLHTDCRHICSNAINLLNHTIDMSIYVPSSLISIGDGAFAGKSWYTINLYTLQDNSYDMSNLKYLGPQSMCAVSTPATIQISSSLNSLYGGTFYYTSRNKSMKIPSCITYMGSYAIANCTNYYYSGNEEQWANIKRNLTGGIPSGYSSSSLINDTYSSVPFMKYYNLYINDNELLTNLDFNNSDVSIENYAFALCDSLQAVNVSSNIGKYTFFMCRNLISVTLNENVTTIDEYAFRECANLTTISLPSSLSSIGERAFVTCSNLVTINYNNTVSNWNAIEKGDSWDVGTGNYTIHCTDGDITKS